MSSTVNILYLVLLCLSVFQVKLEAKQREVTDRIKIRESEMQKLKHAIEAFKVSCYIHACEFIHEAVFNYILNHILLPYLKKKKKDFSSAGGGRECEERYRAEQLR